MGAVSPRDYLDGTKFTWEIRKPHPGLIQFVIVFPDDNWFVWREIEFHDTTKVASNRGSVQPFVPVDWLVETKEERSTRIDREAPSL